MGRSAIQERFYDTDSRSKSTCGPQTTISPPGLFGLSAGLSLALLRCLSGLCDNEDLAGLTLKLKYHQPKWTYLIITHSSHSHLYTTLATIQRILYLWKDRQHHHSPSAIYFHYIREQADISTAGISNTWQLTPKQPRVINNATAQELKTEPDSRAYSEESCPICGDKVSGYHYGLLTCESCKGFFKRSVQNNKHYTCAEQQSCPMNLSQRKRCPFCRFQKCLAVGMKREAVRADRMRGGRNKFGPLYRQDRQMKQQRVYHQANTAPYRIKMETTQTHPSTASSDPHLISSHTSAPLSSDAFHQTHMYPPGIGQSGAPMPLDCTMSADRVLTPLPLPYPGLYHRTFPGYFQEKGEMPFSYSPAPSNYTVHPTQNNSFTPRSTPASSPCSTPSSVTPQPPQASTQNPDTSSSAPLTPSFLSQLLEGEPDESQLCAKVLTTLQREQANRGKHDRLNTFSIMCKMADQTLFGLVEWARNSALFKELKVEDQMVLLQSCWSELLVLDHLCRQVAYGKEGCIYLVTGQQIEVSTIISQAGATLSSLVSRTQDLVSKLKGFQLDRHEFVCLKYLVLFNPDVKSLQNRRQVEQTQERVNRALMEHTQQSHPRHSDKFGQLLLRLPEVRSISLQVEEYLYQRHLLGDLPCNSLLTEMLHTKHN